MMYYVCAVRDVKSEAYGRPFAVQAPGLAMRDFEKEVNRADENNPLYLYPQDFALFLLAKYDDASGKLDQPDSCPSLIIEGVQCKKIMEVPRAQE